MPAPKAPQAPDVSETTASAPPQKSRQKGLKDGEQVRVELVRGHPLWCHTHETYLTPGNQPVMTVDSWVRANLERGNIRIVG